MNTSRIFIQLYVFDSLFRELSNEPLTLQIGQLNVAQLQLPGSSPILRYSLLYTLIYLWYVAHASLF